MGGHGRVLIHRADVSTNGIMPMRHTHPGPGSEAGDIHEPFGKKEKVEKGSKK